MYICTCIPELGSPIIAVFAFTVDAYKNKIVMFKADLKDSKRKHLIHVKRAGCSQSF